MSHLYTILCVIGWAWLALILVAALIWRIGSGGGSRPAAGESDEQRTQCGRG